MHPPQREMFCCAVSVWQGSGQSSHSEPCSLGKEISLPQRETGQGRMSHHAVNHPLVPPHFRVDCLKNAFTLGEVFP